jgi:hypothetical protein
MNCAQTVEQLDGFIDGELSASDANTVRNHLRGCEACSAILASRRALQERLRGFGRGAAMPAGLQDRVVARLNADDAQIRNRRGFLAAAAAVLLTGGAYVSWRSKQMSPVLRVGVEQHIHCAVNRVYPASLQTHPDLDPGCAPLAAIVRGHIPAEYPVAMTHHCESAEGRKFTHVIAHGDAGIVSLLVTKRRPGETLALESAVEHYAVTGFGKDEHLVYLVSDWSEERNRHSMEAMRPELDTAVT